MAATGDEAVKLSQLKEFSDAVDDKIDGVTDITGNAATATALETARTIRVNLASNSSASFDGSANITPGVTGTLPIGHGGTGLTSAPSMLTNLASTTAASPLQASPRPGVTGTLPISNGGTGNTTGNAATATALATARTIRTNLASTSTASFDGSANVTPGVTGTLPITNGGTGLTSAPSMLVNLASTTAASPLQASPRPGITGTLAIGHGGTGATSASAARTALSVPSTSEVGTWTQFTYTSSSSSPTNWSGSANIKVYYNDVLNILWMQSNASIAYNGSSSTASAEWIAVDAGSLADRLEYRTWDSCVRITTSGIIGISIIYDSDSEEFKIQSFVTGGSSSATNLYVTAVLLLDL